VAAGYSKKPLPQKLGIGEGFRIAIINAPPGYGEKLGKLPLNVSVKNSAVQLDLIHFFAKSGNQLEEKFPELKKKLRQKGAIWISWPKKTSSETSDLDDHAVRKIGLDNGMVGVKVAAIDETWAGLKFVFRADP